LTQDFSLGCLQVVRALDRSRNVFAPQDGHSVSKELWHMLYNQKQEKSVHGHLPGV
jgi:hypothetical protein